MPKKPRKPASPVVASLADARARRELDTATAEIKRLSRVITGHVNEVMDLYHAWEAAHPDEASRPVDKVEMAAFGFFGPAGFTRCHEEHRLPVLAFVGAQANPQVFDDAEFARVAMCPALESGGCERVWKAMSVPPCVLLGSEIAVAIGKGIDSDLGSAVLEGGFGSPDDEQQRLASARKLVRKHQKLEE